MRRDLELGDPLGEELGERLLGELGTGTQHDRGRDRFAQPLVGHAEHGGFGDVGVLVDRRFDLGAVDVLAAAQHHVLGAVDDEHVARPRRCGAMSPVWNQPSRMASAVASVSVEVALDHDGAANAELTDGVGPGSSTLPSSSSRRPSSDRHDAPARRRLGGVELGGVGGDDAAGFGEAVAGRGHAVRERLVDLVDEVGLDRCAAASIDLSDEVSRIIQSGCSSISRLMVGTPEKLVTLSRSMSSSARAGIPLVHEHDRSARERARLQQAVVGGDVEQRRREPGRPATGRGVAAGAAGAGRAPAAIALRSAIAATIVMNTMFITLCTEPRWVIWAPFGKPVVPDV